MYEFAIAQTAMATIYGNCSNAILRIISYTQCNVYYSYISYIASLLIYVAASTITSLLASQYPTSYSLVWVCQGSHYCVANIALLPSVGR